MELDFWLREESWRCRLCGIDLKGIAALVLIVLQVAVYGIQFFVEGLEGCG